MSSLRTQLKRFKIIFFILIVIILVLAFLFLRERRSGNLSGELNIETVQARDVERIVSEEGVLRGVDERDVYLPSASKITEIRVDLGQKVDKDAVLAVIESVSGTRVASVEIKAPIAGKVAQLNYQVDDLALASLPAFKIVDDSSYRVDLSVNESDIIYVEVGQETLLTFPAISLDDSYDGSVESVALLPVEDGSIVNYKVVVVPNDLPSTIKLGMSVDVEIITARVEDVLAIPETYLVEKDDKYFVKVLTWNDANKTAYTVTEEEVTVGLVTDEYAELKAGVKAGTEILEPTFQTNSGFDFFNS